MSLPPLTPDQSVKPPRFELRLSLLYAAIFLPMGIHLPYFPLWLEYVGFGAREIGIVLAAPMFLRVVTTLLITASADRARDRANVLLVLSVSTLVLSFGYFLPPGYLLILGVSLALAVVWTPHAPIADSLALSGVRRFGSDYSRMRIWGSTAFLVANFGGGFLLSFTGIGAVPLLISAGMATVVAASLVVPRLGRPRKASPLSAAELQQGAPSLLRPAFLYFVGGCGLVVASHGFLYAFSSIYWQSLGISGGVIGLLWSWSVVAEVGMFAIFTRLFGRTPAWRLVALAGLAAFVRWVAFPMIWPAGLGIAGFFAVQTLHALSTGLILIGLQKMIAETVPEDRTGAAQGIAFFANGFSMAAVTLGSGQLYAALGVNGFYVMAVMALAAVGLVLRGSRLAP